MRTDDEVIELIDAALIRIHAPDDVLDAALREADSIRRRRRVGAGVGAAAAVVAVVVAVALGGLLSSNDDDGSLNPVTGPATTPDPQTDASKPPGDLLDPAEMTALLNDIAPGHAFANLSAFDGQPHFIGDRGDGGDDSLQLYGTVDGTFFTIFVQTIHPMNNQQLREFTECGPNPSVQVVYCDGGYQTYLGGTSRLMMESRLGAEYDDQGQIVDGTANDVTLNSANVFYPSGLSVGAEASNSASQGSPPAITDEPVFSLDELEQIVTDHRWVTAVED